LACSSKFELTSTKSPAAIVVVSTNVAEGVFETKTGFGIPVEPSGSEVSAAPASCGGAPPSGLGRP
jgi:hypothetical protein